jgi:hypothetical protein
MLLIISPAGFSTAVPKAGFRDKWNNRQIIPLLKIIKDTEASKRNFIEGTYVAR